MTQTLRLLAAVSCVAFFASCGDDDDGGGGNGNAPVITKVAWTKSATCVAGTMSAFTITVTATDSDTAATSLTYSGSVSSCTGTISAATGTVTCPNASPYSGSVTVKDPENNSDTQTFTMEPCKDGMVTP